MQKRLLKTYARHVGTQSSLETIRQDIQYYKNSILFIHRSSSGNNRKSRQHHHAHLMSPTIFPHKRSNYLQIFAFIIFNKQLLLRTHKCHESTAHTQFLRTRKTREQKKPFLQDISFNHFYREKQVLKWLTRLV